MISIVNKIFFHYNHYSFCLSNCLKSLDRRCTYGKLTYEKNKGYELIKAVPYRLYMIREGGWFFSTCGRLCKSDTKCMGFHMGHNRSECRLFKNSKNNPSNLRPSSGVAFFEAICLTGKFVNYKYYH